MKNNLMTGLLIAASAVALAGCGKTVEPGSVGVKIRTLGGGGVQREPLTSGWHANGIGERIVQFPTIQRTYAYTREKNEDGDQNEELTFTDRTGLPMTADVQAVIRVEPHAAPKLYTKYRLDFDQLLDGPIRNDVRTAIAAETEKVGVDDLLAGGRQAVISRAAKRVQAKWSREGVSVSQLDWVGTIRFPGVITEAIKSRTQADQQKNAAQAQVAVAQANAQVRIENARGVAEANQLIATSIRANPEIIHYRAVDKWNGQLPQATGGAMPFVNLK